MDNAENIQAIDFGELKKKKKKKETKSTAVAKKENEPVQPVNENQQKNVAQPQVNVQDVPQQIQQQEVVKQLEETKAEINIENQQIQQQQQASCTYINIFTYEELLNRVNILLKERNPNLAEKTKFVMKPPQVIKISGKRSAWINFTEICKTMKRNPEHVCLFFLTELGTEGSVSGEQLILKGRYVAKNIETLIKKYITEFVCCPLCKSPNTILIKDSTTRLYIMKCEQCKSERSVTSIKQGFQAIKQGERRRDKQNQ